MKSALQKIPLKLLIRQLVMFDANIFMVGIENRSSCLVKSKTVSKQGTEISSFDINIYSSNSSFGYSRFSFMCASKSVAAVHSGL